MPTAEPPQDPKNWPLLHCPRGTNPRSILPVFLAGDGLAVLTDLFQTGSYWAIVKHNSSNDQPFALLCLTKIDPDRCLRYFIIPETMGFPLIPPRSFYAHIRTHCPAPPSDVAQTSRARFEQHYLDALPD
jgi:hypothetical protein